jgi:hydroxysqualene synthase
LNDRRRTGTKTSPSASTLIAPKHRSVILAYYRFARGADDVADSPSLSPDAKLAGLNQFEATLTGQSDTILKSFKLTTALPYACDAATMKSL